MDSPFADFETKLLQSYRRSERYPADHCCPRGAESGRPGIACWQDDESCSYCGSLNPDVFMERLEAGDVTLGPTDKSYKVYVHANEGAPVFKSTFRDNNCPGGSDPTKWVWTTRETRDCKFYFQHLTVEQQKRFLELLNEKKLKISEPGRFYRLPFFITTGPQPEKADSQ